MSRRRKGRRNPPRAVQFVITWTPAIRAILRSVSVPFGDLEDCTQEVLILAWTAVKEGRLDDAYAPAVRAWLKVVASRFGIHWAVKRKRTKLDNSLDPAANEDDAELPHLAHDLLGELRAATTPQNWRAWLLRAQDASLEEIAEEERIPVGTVHTRLRLARRDFQAALVRERAREQGPAVPRRKPRK